MLNNLFYLYFNVYMANDVVYLVQVVVLDIDD